MATSAPASFAQLLEHAVNEPGILSNAYRQFYGYSLGNQLLALSQCLARGIQPGPIATFQRWKELGRYVRRGEKAITLCRPVTVQRTTTADDGTDETAAATFFVYRPQWFVMAQTEASRLRSQSRPRGIKTGHSRPSTSRRFRSTYWTETVYDSHGNGPSP
jgi:hypothetical protein